MNGTKCHSHESKTDKTQEKCLEAGKSGQRKGKERGTGANRGGSEREARSEKRPAQKDKAAAAEIREGLQTSKEQQCRWTYHGLAATPLSFRNLWWQLKHFFSPNLECRPIFYHSNKTLIRELCEVRTWRLFTRRFYFCKTANASNARGIVKMGGQKMVKRREKCGDSEGIA